MSLLLSINNYYYHRGGSEVVFFGHNKLLQESGWEVVPFSMRHANNQASSWDEYFIENSDMGNSASMYRKTRYVGRLIYSFEARHNLRKLLGRVSPDLCHLHNIYHHISPSILSLLRARGVPVVMTLHDLKLACPAYSMMNRGAVCERCKGGRVHNVVRYRCIKNSFPLSSIILAERVLHDVLRSYDKNVNNFIVPSRFNLEKLVEWGWDRERFIYIPNFIDTGLFTPQFEPGRRFVCFGRLSQEKGVAVLIEAATRAGVPVTVIGTGPEEQALKELAYELRTDVIFAGYLSGSALYAEVAAARAVVLPSVCYENAPMALMEAYALGKPVIASAIGGIPELVREDTGVTFPAGSAYALAVALREFKDKPATVLSDMGRTARGWMRDEFGLERYRERILSMYRKLGVSC